MDVEGAEPVGSDGQLWDVERVKGGAAERERRGVPCCLVLGFKLYISSFGSVI